VILPGDVVAFILGGGQGADMYPLTNHRAEPAVPLLGTYRLIDIIVSNCLNSSVTKVFVLTQFNSRPLNRHLAQAYSNVGPVGLGPDGAFVEPLNATLTSRKDSKGDWFSGTADAVRQYLWMLNDQNTQDAEEVMVLCGDQM
jgi:glucose-1-phosphate adenylyltransferase